MAAEDIESPPYPGEGTNTDVLYNLLRALKKWVTTYRARHNKAICQDLIPTVRDFPDKKAYLAQPVLTQMHHLTFLRRVREEWDHLVRTYEHDWDNPTCVRARVMMLQAAAVLLNSAFVPFEVREMEAQREPQRLQRVFERLTDALKQHLEPESHDIQPGPEAEE